MMHVMLILLPPSEGKTAPRRGKALDLPSLSWPELTPARQEVLAALESLCRADAEAARQTLGLSTGQLGDVARNASLRAAPTARAAEVYSGVLYASLGLPGLRGADLRRANAWIAISSGLWGLLAPSDRIPAYRLSGDVRLPAIGGLQAYWREQLASWEPPTGPVIDLRSGIYASMWQPGESVRNRYAEVRVVRDAAGAQGARRTTVSHHNKATKGAVARSLLTAAKAPRNLSDVVECLVQAGFRVDTGHATAGRLEIVID